MDRKRDESPDTERYLKTGALLDAAGFGGAETNFDLVDFIEAAHDSIPHRTESDEYKRYLSASFAAEYDNLRAAHYPDDKAASYLVGSVLWRQSVQEMNETGRVPKAAVSQAIRSISLARHAFGRGDERLLQLALVRYTEDFAYDYPRRERSQLRALCLFAEDECRDTRVLKPLQLSSVESQVPYLVSIGRAMALIGMFYGYSIMPPPEQTDENGTWQLPEEYSEDDDE